MRYAFAFPLACSLVLLVSEGSAEAQSRRIRDSNWRQSDRGGVDRKDSAQRFALELRGGLYYPAVDEEFGGATPYADFFGDDGRFYFGLEFDWQALRIPWVGSLGPGFGAGYTSATAKAFLKGTYGTSSATRVGSASLNIVPMHLSAVLRIDELMQRTGFPFVPYAKLGLGVGLWWATDGTGASEVKTADGQMDGRGTSYGVHWALGGMLSLDWLGRRSMASLDQESGINHVYVFGEWMNQDLGLGSNEMHVGTSSWAAGLAFEM